MSAVKPLKTRYSELNLIKAGAGAGKTYHIQQTLIEWIKQKTIAADRILAVTFTKAAANELQQRIKMALMQAGLYQQSQLLAQSQISTIHQFGLQLLKDYAFEVGYSPEPRQLSEAEEKIILQKILANVSTLLPIIQDLSRYHYHGSYGSDGYLSAADVFRQHVNKVLSIIRNIDIHGDTQRAAALIAQAKKQIRQTYGQNLQKAETLNTALWQAIKAVRKKYDQPTLEEEWASNGDSRKMVRAIFQASKQSIRQDWGLWSSLQTISAPKINGSGKSKKTHPDQKLAQKIWDIADQLNRHPGPLNDALFQLETLLQTVFDALREYNQLKRSSALVDYNDMVQGAMQILSNRQWLQEVKQRFDCIIIDEFQDTNPMQFALLWSLKQAGIATLIVGDVKQSIMGFQGADRRLFAQLMANYPQNTSELTGNWRSSAGLMKYINKVGKALYDKDYTKLQPRANLHSKLKPVVFIDFPTESWSASRSKNKPYSFNDDSPYVVCQYLQKMLNSKKKISDRHSGKKRAIRPDDIAILAHSHSKLDDYARVLAEFGLKSQRQSKGFFDSKVIKILLAALAYLANQNDKHAILYLTLLLDAEFDFEGWLKGYLSQAKPRQLKLPLADSLSKLARQIADKALSDQVEAVMEHLQLWQYCQQQDNANQQRANLFQFNGMVKSFEQSQPESLHAQGIYGKGLASFLVWLQENRDDLDKQAKPSTQQQDAIVLSTWHAAKGLEWPVVVVAGMQQEKKPQLPNTSQQYQNNQKLDQILDNAWCQILTQFDDKSVNEKMLDLLEAEHIQTRKNLAYVALTRAREQLVLPWFESNASYSLMRFIESVHYKKAKRITASMPDKEKLQAQKPQASQQLIGRPLIKKQNAPQPINAVENPSVLAEAKKHPASVEPLLQHFRYGEAVALSQLKQQYGADTIGSQIHRLYQALLANSSLKERALATMPEIHQNPETANALTEQIQAFSDFMRNKLAAESWQSEVPILAKAPNGATLSGVIDLLIETKQGYYIVDHKSDTLKQDNKAINQAFLHHLPQLQGYQKSLKSNKPVLGLIINWVILSQITVLQY